MELALGRLGRGRPLGQLLGRRLELLGLQLELAGLVLELLVGQLQLEPLLLEQRVGVRERPRRRLALGEQPLQLPPRADLFSHRGPVDDDAGARTVGLDEGLVDEVDEHLLEVSVGAAHDHRRDFPPDERHAGLEHAVE
jgi:hypothetical protein